MNFSILSRAFVCLAITTVIFSSCKKDDDGDACSTQGTLTCIIDGQNFTASGFNNTLFKGVDNTQGGTEAKRLDIRGEAANGALIILSLSDYRDGIAGNNFRVGKYYMPYNLTSYGVCGSSTTGTYACAGGLVTYYPTGSQTNVRASSGGSGYDRDSTHYVEITANDAAAQTISGRFKVAITDFGTFDEVLVTDGVFTNVCYSVIEQ